MKTIDCPTQKHTHLQAPQALTQTKACKRVCFPLPKEKNNKSPLTLKNKTLQTHNPTDKNDIRNDRKQDNNKGLLVINRTLSGAQHPVRSTC